MQSMVPHFNLSVRQPCESKGGGTKHGTVCQLPRSARRTPHQPAASLAARALHPIRSPTTTTAPRCLLTGSASPEKPGGLRGRGRSVFTPDFTTRDYGRARSYAIKTWGLVVDAFARGVGVGVGVEKGEKGREGEGGGGRVIAAVLRPKCGDPLQYG